MSEEVELRHEVVKESGTGFPLLHVYLPEGLTNSDVAVTTGSSPDIAEVFIEHIATERVLSFIQLKDYKVSQDDAVVKYTKKNRRFSIRLVEAVAATPAAAVDALAGSSPAKAGAAVASPVKSNAPLQLSSPSAALAGNGFGLLDNDDVSDDEAAGGGGEGAAGSGKKKKKKKKGKKADVDAGAGGGEQPEAEAPEALTANGNHVEGAAAGGASSGDEAEGAAVAAGGEGAASAAKKKKKKKKKGGAAAGTSLIEAGTVAEAGSAEPEAEVKASATQPDRSSPPPPPTPPEPVTSLPSAPDSGAASSPASGPTKHTSRATVDRATDFGDAKIGRFEVGSAVPYDPLLGPAVHSALGKYIVKGEDRWLEAPTNSWSVGDLEGATTAVSVFGIFDGHGGRMAAQHASKNLLPLVARYVERALGQELPSSPEQLAAEGYLDPDAGDGAAAAAAAGEADPEALARARAAAVQDALIARLPKALHAGFVECDEEVITRHKTSGTTATLAVQVGWELLVANVGDSLAYLDTGSEIVVISANHRVAESAEEQERICNAGGRIKPAKYDEDDDAEEGTGTGSPKEGQQLRVWPGGINMTRTIGDVAALGLLIPEPAVRQISLPVTGARLIIASDGLWDAVNAKTVIGQVRKCTAREAAAKAAVYAMRNNKHDDDITVVVVDFVPRASDTHVPGLLKRATGPAAVAVAALAAAGMREERSVQCWKPLETHSQSWRERHREHRRRAAAYLEQLTVAEKAEEEAKEELERQRRQTVAPPAGTAGVGTARPQPLSDTYRELAGLKISTEDLQEDWTTVDAKKKRDAGGGGGFDLRRELMKAARPGEPRTARSPGGGGGREERPDAGGRWRERGGGERDREQRRLSRNERDGNAAAAKDTAAPEAVAVAVAAAMDDLSSFEYPQQQAPRGERRERRDRGGRGGGRTREGAAAAGAGRGGGSVVTAEVATEACAGVAAVVPAGAATPPMQPGIVKTGGVLCVPKSMLTGGAGTPAATAAAAASGGADAGNAGAGGKPQRERAPRGGGPLRSRRGGAAPSSDAVQDGTEGAPHASKPPAAGEDGSALPPTNLRRTTQRRRLRETVAAAEGATGGLPTGLRPAPAAAAAAMEPVQSHVPATSSSDPVVVLEPNSVHRPRRKQGPYGAAQRTAAATPPPRHNRPAPAGQAAAAAPPAQTPSAPPPSAQYAASAPVPQPRPQAYQQQLQQAPPQQAAQEQQQPQQARATVAAAAAAPPLPAVPTYAGPLDFGAGFGPGSNMWPASGASGGGYGGFAANGGGPAPERPPGLGGAPGQRNQSEVAAAAAAAAAAAVARKAVPGRGGGAGQYAAGRT